MGDFMKRLYQKNGFSGADILPLDALSLFLDGKEDKRINERKGKVAVAHAESWLDVQIPALLASDFMRYSKDGDRMIYERPFHERRKALVTLAIAEAYEGEGRFVNKALDYLFCILEESTWVVPAHQRCNPTTTDGVLPPLLEEGSEYGIDLFAATTASVIATAYLCLGKQFDGISPDINKRIGIELKRRIFRPFAERDYLWTGEAGSRPSNWNPWITSNVLYANAVLNGELQLRRAVCERAMRYLDNYTSYIPNDGGCDEGPSYWSSAGASCFDCAEILYDMSGGKINIFAEPLLKQMCEYEAKFHIDDKRFINFADCPPGVLLNPSQIARMGERLTSPVMSSFAYTVAKNNPVALEASHGYRVFRGFFDESVACDSSCGFTDVWFPDLKVMVARENPETNRGIFVAVKGGNNGEHHNHNDMGNIMVCYDGKPVVIDNGAGEYTKITFSSQRYTLWYMQSGYHNTVTVNGITQHDGEQYRTTDEIYNKDERSVSMQLKCAYPECAGIESLVRSVRLDGGRIVITDKVSLHDEGHVQIHFLLKAEPVIEGRRVAIGEGRTLTFDERMTPEVECIALDTSLVKRWKSDSLYMLRLNATVKDAELVTFIE